MGLQSSSQLTMGWGALNVMFFLFFIFYFLFFYYQIPRSSRVRIDGKLTAILICTVY